MHKNKKRKNTHIRRQYQLTAVLLLFLLSVSVFVGEYALRHQKAALLQARQKVQQQFMEETNRSVLHLKESLSSLQLAADILTEAGTASNLAEQLLTLPLSQTFQEITVLLKGQAISTKGMVGVESLHSTPLEYIEKGQRVVSYIAIPEGAQSLLISIPMVQEERVIGGLFGEFGSFFSGQSMSDIGQSYLVSAAKGQVLEVKYPEREHTATWKVALEKQVFAKGEALLENGEHLPVLQVNDSAGESFSVFISPIPVNDWYVVSVLPDAALPDSIQEPLGEALGLYWKSIAAFLLFAGVVFYISTKHAREHRQQQEELFAIADRIPGGFCKCEPEPDREFVYCNDTFLNIFKYTRETLPSRFIDLIYEPDRALARKMFLEHLPVCQNSELEYRAKAQDGSMLWIMERSSVLKADDGRRILYCSITDITALKTVEQELKNSEERYQLALEHSDHGIFEFNPSENRIYLGKMAMEYCGLPQILYNARHFLMEGGIVHSDDLDSMETTYHALADGKEKMILDIRLRYATGQYQWNRLMLTGLYDTTGALSRIIGLMEDISEEKQVQQQLQQEKKYRETIQKIYEIHLEANLTKDRFIGGQEEFQRALDMPYLTYFSEILYMFEKEHAYFAERISCRQIFDRRYLQEQFLRGETEIELEFRAKRPRAGFRWWQCHISLYQNEEEDICALFFLKDINPQKQEMLYLRRKAERDSLTGLYNKGAVEKMISKYLENNLSTQEEHALFVLDLDGFKQVNDTMGHAAGDFVLKQVGERLQRSIRKSDIAGRIGGDEFVILLKNISNENAAGKVAQSILESIQALRLDQNKPASITVSIGIVLCPGEAVSYETLYRQADIALYESKRKGKNMYTIYAEDQGAHIVQES